jgi:hypothetical protein
VSYISVALINLHVGTRSCISAGQWSLNSDHRSLSWLNLSLAHWKKWPDMCTLEHLELELKMALKYLNINNNTINNLNYQETLYRLIMIFKFLIASLCAETTACRHVARSFIYLSTGFVCLSLSGRISSRSSMLLNNSINLLRQDNED